MRSRWQSRIKRVWISGSSEVYVTDDQFVRLENGPTGKILGDVMSVITNPDELILYDLPVIASSAIPAPTSAFTSSLGNILSASFTDQSTGSPTSWNWDFGDGTTSTQQNPTHVYTTEGAFPVSLTASNAGGSHISTGTRVVINRDGPDSWWRPITSYGWNELLGRVPNLLFLCQDTTGSIFPTIDGVGSGPWAPNLSGHLYQQSVSGWNARHIGLDGAVDNQNWNLPPTSGALDIPLSSSYAMMMYTALGTPEATQRWMVVAGNSNYMDIATGGTVRARHDAATGNSSVHAYDDLTKIHQIAWTRRADIDESGGRTNLETLFATHAETAYAATERSIGSNSATATPTQRTNLLAIFTGSNAEFDMGSAFATLRGVPGIPRFKTMGSFITSATTMTASWPTHEADDVALLVVETNNATTELTFGSQADFVQVENSPQTAESGSNLGTKLWVYWCRASGSAQENPTFEDNGGHQCARIVTFKGCVTTGNPWNVTTGSVITTPSTDVTMPGVSTTVDHTLIVNLATNSFDTTISQFSGGVNNDLRQLKLLFSNNTSTGDGGGIGMWLGEFKGSGSVGETTATLATETVQARMTIALRGTGS